MPNDERLWFYRYDTKGQVVSAEKRFSTNGAAGAGKNFLAGYQTEYAYDEIEKRVNYDEDRTSTATDLEIASGCSGHNHWQSTGGVGGPLFVLDTINFAAVGRFREPGCASALP